MMGDTRKVEYLPDELESLLDHLDNIHNETRGQTIARLEAALKIAKAEKGERSQHATHMEPVMREVTDAVKEPKAKKSSERKRKGR